MLCLNCPYAAICGNIPIYRASFRTRDEAVHVVETAITFCPDPLLAQLGLSEILLNCIEHGNLAFSFDDKAQALTAGTWQKLIDDRLADPTFSRRVAQLSLYRTESSMLFLVCDEGAGFEWDRYLRIEPEQLVRPNGRGIALARQISFNRLDYAGDGSVVLAEINTPFSSPDARLSGRPASP